MPTGVGETDIDCEVWVGVVLHTYELYAVVTATVTAEPIQMVPSLEVVPLISVYPTAGVGSGFTVTVEVAVAVHPFAAVAVTV